MSAGQTITSQKQDEPFRKDTMRNEKFVELPRFIVGVVVVVVVVVVVAVVRVGTRRVKQFSNSSVIIIKIFSEISIFGRRGLIAYQNLGIDRNKLINNRIVNFQSLLISLRFQSFPRKKWKVQSSLVLLEITVFVLNIIKS
jgi:hypothetical protein